MYELIIEKKAQKQLAQIPQPWYNKTVKAIKALANDPRPNGYIKLKGRTAYRIRVGNYRVIYEIHDNILTVHVLIIGDRKEVDD